MEVTVGIEFQTNPRGVEAKARSASSQTGRIRFQTNPRGVEAYGERTAWVHEEVSDEPSWG